MASSPHSQWHRALIIGLGGTGIRALRFFQLLAQEDETGDLGTFLREHRVELIGIDTDDKANQPESVDGRLLAGLADHLGRSRHDLPLVQDMIRIDTEAITNAVSRLRLNSAVEDPEKKAHKAIQSWFPQIIAGGENDLTIGQTARRGAGQWRLLGRIGFFLKYSDIYKRLQQGYNRVKGESKKEPPKVFIVCSLAGGTGSGMFWDTAFLLRSFDERAMISGVFLLPSAFDHLQGQGRVRKNGYAALKELATYKNWRQADTFTVLYPQVGLGGSSYVARPGDRAAFNAVYLYNAFLPPHPANRQASQVILRSCHGLAQNILALMRTDIHVALGEGKDNDTGDAGVDPGQEEGAFVFSSTGCAALHPLASEVAAKQFSVYLLEQLKSSRLAEGRRYLLPNHDLRAALALPGSVPSDVDAWIAGLVTSIANGLPDKPGWIDSLAATFLKGSAEVGTLITKLKTQAPWTAAALVSEVRKIYETHVDETLRNGWMSHIRSQYGLEITVPECEIGDAAKIYRVELDDWFNQVFADLRRLVDTMESKHAPLRNDMAHLLAETSARLRALTANKGDARKALDALLPAEAMRLATSTAPLPPHQPRILKAPPALVTMRLSLGLIRETNIFDKSLRRRHDEYGAVGPVHLALQQFFLEAKASLGDIVQADAAAIAAEHYYAAREALITRGCDLANEIDKVVATHNFLLRALERSINDVSRRMTKVIPDLYSPVWLDQIDLVLEPLTTLFADIPDPATDPQPYKDHALGIVDAIIAASHALAAKGFEGTQIRALNANKGAAVDVWFNALCDLQKKLPALSPAGKDRVRHQAQSAIDGIISLAAGTLSNPTEFKAYIDDLITTGIGFFSYWCDLEENVMQRMGGISGITETIQGCLPQVFIEGVKTNSISRSNLVVVPPDLRKPGQVTKITENLETGFRTAAEAVDVGAPSLIAPSRHPTIFFEDLCRSAEEIDGIATYYEEYRHIPPGRRRNYHLFPNADKLPDLVPEFSDIKHVGCGNGGGCSQDIRLQPATDLTCAQCGKSIRNRCGNPHCTELDLKARIDERRIGDLSTDANGVPFDCPACNGRLRTYWWYCPVHKDWPISTDITDCPRCEKEHATGRRKHRMMERFKDGRGFECPGCIGTGAKREHVHRIPWSLEGFFYDGVHPGKQQSEFEELIDRHHMKPFECGNQRKKIHFLFPTYRDPDGLLHHVYREAQDQTDEKIVWNTTCRTSQPVFNTCFHCDYPVSVPSGKILIGEADTPLVCPRCQRALKHCSFCSRHDNMLFQAEAHTNGSLLRCPRCTNTMWPIKNGRANLSIADSWDVGFCRNVFGCPAGAEPWSTAASMNMDRCVVCDGLLGKGGALLPYPKLHDYVSDCSLCLHLIGLPKNGEIRKLGAREILYRFMRQNMNGTNSARPVDIVELGEPCPICAVGRGAALHWLSQSEVQIHGDVSLPFFDHVYTAAEAQDDLALLRQKVANMAPVPTIQYDHGIELLEILSRHLGEGEAYNQIDRQGILKTHGDNLSALREQFDQFFGRTSVSAHSLRRRLKAVSDRYKNYRSRERSRDDTGRGSD